MAKEFSHSRGFRHPTSVIVANGPVGTGNHKASLRFSIWLVPISTKSFSLSRGRFLTAQSTLREVQRSTFAFGRTPGVSFRLFGSNTMSANAQRIIRGPTIDSGGVLESRGWYAMSRGK